MDIHQIERDRIEKTIANAGLLLEFSARHAIEIPEESIKAVLVSSECYRENSKLTAKEELSLRLAYRDICLRMQPRTVESINDCTEIKGLGNDPTGSLLRSLNGWLTIFSIVVLIAVLLGQFNWLKGQNLAERVGNRLQAYEKVQQQIVDLEAVLNGRPMTTPDIDAKYIEMELLFGELVAEGQALQAWNERLPFASVVAGPSTGYGLADVPTKVRTDLSNARILLVGGAAFILPPLYGLLGSCVWVIRRRMEKIANATYTKRSTWLDWTRISLGPIAGLAVGLLLKAEVPDQAIEETFSALRALSPLGLAFVSGYGIEILYSLLDRIVKAVAEPSRDADI